MRRRAKPQISQITQIGIGRRFFAGTICPQRLICLQAVTPSPFIICVICEICGLTLLLNLFGEGQNQPAGQHSEPAQRRDGTKPPEIAQR
jgi:hypothetical protein